MSRDRRRGGVEGVEVSHHLRERVVVVRNQGAMADTEAQ
jgi:hypothetical protein